MMQRAALWPVSCFCSCCLVFTNMQNEKEKGEGPGSGGGYKLLVIDAGRRRGRQ